LVLSAAVGCTSPLRGRFLRSFRDQHIHVGRTLRPFARPRPHFPARTSVSPAPVSSLPERPSHFDKSHSFPTPDQPRHVLRGLLLCGPLLSHPLAGLPEHGTLRSCGRTPYLVLSAQRLESWIIVGGTLAYVLGARMQLCGLRGGQHSHPERKLHIPERHIRVL